jgi:hypothetical protein
MWDQYFRANQYHFDHLDWATGTALTKNEKQIITSSIRQFQKGEHSEGKNFLKYARDMKDESYVEAVRVFIKEEQDHAFVLGRFMEAEQIEKLRDDWLDSVFRWLRKLAGLECTVTVLLTAEIISMVYYKALQLATNSILLRQICQQILTDEEMHLRFQGFTLAVLYKRKSFLSVNLSRLLHSTLMGGTIIMVWHHHRKVLRAGGYSFFLFFREVWKEFNQSGQVIRNKGVTAPVSKSINHAA